MEIIEKIEIPKDIECKLENNMLIVKSGKGTTKRKFLHEKIKIGIENNHVTLSSKKYSKREKTVIGAFKSHIKNMLKGKLYTYTLKICSGHFPMNIKIEKNELKISNFLGEKTPRRVKLIEDVNARLDGDHIIVESLDKEKAGQAAADIENLTKRPGFDPRIFQDGIYIVSKPERDIK